MSVEAKEILRPVQHGDYRYMPIARIFGLSNEEAKVVTDQLAIPLALPTADEESRFGLKAGCYVRLDFSRKEAKLYDALLEKLDAASSLKAEMAGVVV